MIFLKQLILLIFVLFPTIFSFGMEEHFFDKENKDDLLLQYFDPENVTDQIAEDCDKHTCKEEKCNCCPGYGVRAGNFMSKDTCRRCNCGGTFSCSYTNWDVKTCYCDTGYTDVSGICIADCKVNPCENGGTCIAKNYEVFCVCKEPYTGKLCDKEPTTEVITKPENTTNETVETTTDLATDIDAWTTETFENMTSNETLTTTESFENITSNDILTTTESFENKTSESTSDIITMEPVNITSSTMPVEETTSTTETITIITSGTKWTETLLIASCCIIVLMILFTVYMIYRRKYNV